MSAPGGPHVTLEACLLTYSSQQRTTADPDAVPREDAAMHLDLSDEETRALLNLLVETIEADRYRVSGSCKRSSPSVARWAAHYHEYR